VELASLRRQSTWTAGWFSCPESPGFRRGLLVPFARVKLSARLGNADHQKAEAGGFRVAYDPA